MRELLETWRDIVREPTWYRTVSPHFAQIESLGSADQSTSSRLREDIFDFFERSLQAGTVALGTTGRDWDAERSPIDTIIIHHTSIAPGISNERISAIELVRLYAAQYAKQRDDEDVAGQPIWSNHVRDGRQVFWPYHWIVRIDGTCDRLLEDTEIGWHAGDWDINRRSVAICFDGDYEHAQPPEAALEAAAKLIAKRYSSVPVDAIKGHCEVRHDRTCPSQLFLPHVGGTGWKAELVRRISAQKAGT